MSEKAIPPALALLVVLACIPVLQIGGEGAASGRGFGWTKCAANPVMPAGASNEWDYPLIYSDCILQDGGELKLYYSGINSAWTRYSQGIATSTDGRSWTRYAGNPVLKVGAAGAWDDYYVGGASVIKDGGTYKMWYHGHDHTHWRIGYATSPDGLAWTKYAGNPVLDIGGAGSWDRNHLVFPNVIKDGDGYKMYYGGEDGTRTNIGLATSVDGISWTRCAQNPVLTRGGAGQSTDVNGPCVLERDGKYLMWYNGYNGAVWSIDFATSDDGVSWTKYDGNPVLQPGTGFESNHVYLPCVWFNGTTYQMIYTGVTSGDKCAFGLAAGNTVPDPPTNLAPSSLAWTNDTRPAFSWKFRDPDAGDRQSAFEVQVAHGQDFGALDLATGRVPSANGSYVPEHDLPDGVHCWRVRAWDDFGDNGTWSWPGTVAIDTVPPDNPANLTSTSHTVGAWSASNIVNVTWSQPPGEDRSGIAGYSIAWDLSPDTVPQCTLMLDENNTKSSSLALSDGAGHYFHIRARDGAGNWANGAAHLGPFNIDTALPANPQVESTSHKARLWSADNTVDISIKAGPPGLSGVAGYAVSWDTSAASLPGPAVNLSEGTQASTSPALADGNSWYFHLRTENSCGLWSAGAVHLGPFWIDTTPPVVTAFRINSGAAATADRQVSLDIGAADPAPGSGLQKMRLSEDGRTWTGWEDYTPAKGFSLSGPDGIHTLFVQVQDAVGNPGPAASASILLDSTAPRAVSVSVEGAAGPNATGGEGSPPPGMTGSRQVTVRLNATDPEPGTGVAEMSLSLDGISWGPWEPYSRARNLTLPIGDGPKTVYVRFRDALGNAGEPASASILLDTAPPSGLSISIEGGAGVVSSRTVRLALDAADPAPGSGLWQMSFSADGTAWSGWEPFNFSGTYSFPSDGNQTLRFRARDRSGNIAPPASASIFVDTTIPRIVSLKVIRAGLKNATLSVTTDEPCRLAVEYGTGTGYGRVAETEGFSTVNTVVLPRLIPGQVYHFRVLATDRGGNPSAASADQRFSTPSDTNGPPGLGLLAGLLVAALVATAFALLVRRRRRGRLRSI